VETELEMTKEAASGSAAKIHGGNLMFVIASYFKGDYTWTTGAT
jgi:hypothetical protein